MTNKLEDYLRIAEIHKVDPELKKVDGGYIIKKLKEVQREIVELTNIVGAENEDIENLNKIEGALKIYGQY